MKKATLKHIKELESQFINETFGKDKPKRNKRHYEKWLNKIGEILTDHREYMDFATKKAQKTENFGANFNLIYDQEYALEYLRDDIQRWCYKRQWTFQDYQSYELIRLNID
jgi:hypothetical protein